MPARDELIRRLQDSDDTQVSAALAELVGDRVRSGTRVTGWDSVPPADRPPVAWLIHLCFDVMAGLGFLLLVAGPLAAWTWWRRGIR